MKNFDFKSKKVFLTAISIGLAMLMLGVSYAFFTVGANNENPESASIEFASLALIFSDYQDNLYAQDMQFGQTITKKFKIQNTGESSASMALDWDELVNTYMDKSLTYTLKRVSSDGVVQEVIVQDSNMPTTSSDESITRQLAGELTIPGKTVYYYDLEITLNETDEIQNSDLDAIFKTKFAPGELNKYIYYTLSINPNGGEWEGHSSVQTILLQNGETATIPEPVWFGHTFNRWELTGTESTINGTKFTMGASDTTLKAIWDENVYTLVVDPNGGTYSGALNVSMKFGTTTTISTPTRTGYTFAGWDVVGGTLEGNTFTLLADGDAKITARWVLNEYNYVVYHYKQNVDGSYPSTPTDTDYGYADFGTTVTPGVKSYTGFTSPTEKKLTIQEEKGSTPTVNIVEYQYTRNRYTLYVDANGGTYTGETPVYDITYGSSVTLGSISREGYDFSKWVATGTGASVTSAGKFTMGPSDAYATATWTPKTYQVTFNANGGGVVTPGSIVVTYDDLYPELPVPSRPGYAFTGWFTAASGGSQVFQGDTVSITDAQTLYAHWTVSTAVVTFNANGGQWQSGTITWTTQDINETYGANYSLPIEPTRTNYVFNGWFTAATGGTQITASTKFYEETIQTLYAQWTLNVVTVTFNANGGNFNSLDGNPTTTTLDLTPGANYSFPDNPAKGGYNFTGWFTTATGTTQVTTSTVITNTSAHTLYAHWSAVTMNAYFRSNNGTFSDGTTSQTIVQTFDAYYVLPSANPTRTGYTFKGWFTTTTGTVQVTASTIVSKTANHYIYAQWTARTMYVYFQSNGGAWSDGTTSWTMLGTYDSVYSFPANNPTRTGYTFNGWWTASSGGTQVTTSTVVATTSNHYIYAQWNVATPTVYFYANGGQYSDGTTTYKSVVQTYGYTFSVPLDEPTRAGYVFLGWYTSSAAGAGALMTRTTIFYYDYAINVFAHWKGVLSQVLMAKANPETDYAYGNVNQLYPFYQTNTYWTLSTYDYRFIGSNPYNYVWYNGSRWRIIGIFDVEGKRRVKLMAWENETNEVIQHQWGANDDNYYPASALTQILNYSMGSLYRSSLSTTARGQIGNARWFLGAFPNMSSVRGGAYYSTERGNTYNTWSSAGYAGLIYPSDYALTYGMSVNDDCYVDPYNCGYNGYGNPSTSWMYTGRDMWTISPYGPTSAKVVKIFSGGYTDVANASLVAYLYPTVYLNADITTQSGSGTYGDPYILDSEYTILHGVYWWDENYSGTYINTNSYIDGTTAATTFTFPYGNAGVDITYYVDSEQGWDFFQINYNGSNYVSRSGQAYSGSYAFGTLFAGDQLEFLYSKDAANNTSMYTDHAEFTLGVRPNFINSTYWFGWNYNTGRYESNNQFVNSSIARTTYFYHRYETVRISYGVDSEQNYDKFRILYNGTKVVGDLSGANNTGTYVTSVGPGDRLTFEYEKDNTQYANTDMAWFYFY